MCGNNYKDEYVDTAFGEVSFYNTTIIIIGKLKICNRCFEKLVKDFYDSGELESLAYEKRETEKAKQPKIEIYKKKPIPNKLRWEVWKKDNFTCLKCGSRDNLVADHIIPESKGGKMEISNLQTLCQKCNSKKGLKNMDYRKQK